MCKVSAALALFALACGGEQGAGQQQTPAAATPSPAEAPAAIEGTGTVHDVEMLQTADGNYRYQPASLTIKLGDTVRWINVSGLPHNVAFYADKIPEGAGAQIDALMPAEGKLGPMNGRLMIQPNDTFEMTFANVPTGDYGYFCVPHEALGMTATLTIEQ